MSDNTDTKSQYHELLEIVRLCKDLGLVYVSIAKTPPEFGTGTTVVGMSKKQERFGTMRTDTVFTDKDIGSTNIALVESRLSVIEHVKTASGHSLEFSVSNSGVINKISAKAGRSKSSVLCQSVKGTVMKYIPDKITHIDDDGRIIFDSELSKEVIRIVQSTMISATTDIEKEQANITFHNEGDDLIMTSFDGRSDAIERCYDGLATKRKLSWSYDLTSFSQLMKIASQKSKDGSVEFGVTEKGFMSFHIGPMKCIIYPRDIQQ